MAAMDFAADLFVVQKFGEGDEIDNDRALIQVVENDADGVHLAFNIPSRKDRVFLTFKHSDLVKALESFANKD